MSALTLASAGPAADLFGCGSVSSEDSSLEDLYSFDEEEQALLRRMARRMAISAIGTVLVNIFEYLVEDGRKAKVRGAGMRAFVAASAVLPQMHGLTQTQI